MINSYSQGNRIRTSAAFTNANGQAIDPATVTCKYKTPAGTITTKTYGIDGEVVKDGPGNYHLDIDASAVGAWYVRWYSTGEGQAASKSQFLVLESEI